VERLNDARILIYSHDSFGLGHLRRCRAIAHAVVERFKGVSVLILSGSPIIGSFDFRSRVDFVRVPGVIKLRNGEYTSLNLRIALDQGSGRLSSPNTGGPPCSMVILDAITPGMTLAHPESSV